MGHVNFRTVDFGLLRWCGKGEGARSGISDATVGRACWTVVTPYV